MLNEVSDKNGADQAWVEALLRQAWGDTSLIVRGETVDAGSLPALVLGSCGLLTYRRRGTMIEIVSLNAVVSGRGIGTALIDALVARGIGWAASAIIVMTTNDNLAALGFYQRRGFVLDALFVDAIAPARRIKPSIPTIAANGIPIHDEIRLRRRLNCG